MQEKIYKTMNFSGVLSLVIGICTIMAGITAGIMLIVSAGRLLKGKDNILL